MVTPGGRLLAYKNSGEFPDLTREMLADGLSKWAEVKDDPAMTPTAAPADPRYATAPPAGGLTLGVRHRRLTRTSDGFAPGTPDKPGGQLAMRQTLWLTADEVKGLLPPPRAGARANVPEVLRARLARFYAADQTQGDGDPWPKQALGPLTMTVTTVGVSGGEQRVRFDGRFHLTHASVGSCDTRLRGEATWDSDRSAFTRFELVLANDHRRADGREVFHAAAFGLPDPNDLGDRLPPDGVKSPEAYWRNAGP